MGVLYRRVIFPALDRVQAAILKGVQYSLPNIGAVGLVGVVGFPLYYLIWAYWFPQPYENLPLRLLGMALFIPLMLVRYWPRRIAWLFPAYWFVVMLYALPFFFTFMLLKNDTSAVWGMSTMAALFLLVIVAFDWVLVVFIFVLGSCLGWAAHVLTGGALAVPTGYLEHLPIYLFVIVAGSVFSHRKELLANERLDAMFAVSRNVAHELRTPLLSIRSGIGGLRRYLPDLLTGYQAAVDNGLSVPKLRRAHLGALHGVLERMDRETIYATTMIDMLLVSAGRRSVEPEQLETVSMAECVAAALDRYPFRSDEEVKRVTWLGGDDFEFEAVPLLIVHTIFNLLRNALYALSEAGGGQVSLWVTHDNGVGRLHVKDTGTGISPKVLPHIYERFYSSRGAEQGAGIGLFFCKTAVESCGGTIECHTEHGEYTEFVLTFTGENDHG